MRQILIEKMKAVFGTDQKRIHHALAVLDYAEKIQPSVSAQIDIVWASAVLHDIGIQQAERKYNSAAGMYQEMEGPPIARAILESLGWPQPDIDHVCDIVGSHHSGSRIDTPEFRCIWDADWIVNLAEDYADWTQDKKRHLIETVWRTDTGKQLAEKLYL